MFKTSRAPARTAVPGPEKHWQKCSWLHCVVYSGNAPPRALEPFERKPGDFGVLIVIDSNPGLRSTDVCNALGFQKANFAPLLRRLEARVLVKRVESPDDRRAQSLQLTAVGRKLLARPSRE